MMLISCIRLHCQRSGHSRRQKSVLCHDAVYIDIGQCTSVLVFPLLVIFQRHAFSFDEPFHPERRKFTLRRVFRAVPMDTLRRINPDQAHGRLDTENGDQECVPVDGTDYLIGKGIRTWLRFRPQPVFYGPDPLSYRIGRREQRSRKTGWEKAESGSRQENQNKQKRDQFLHFRFSRQIRLLLKCFR